MSTYDVLVVGGGIIGASIAFELSRRNLRVAVLDRQEFLREASWAAAGMLSPRQIVPPRSPCAARAAPAWRSIRSLSRRLKKLLRLRTGYRKDGSDRSSVSTAMPNANSARWWRFIMVWALLASPCRWKRRWEMEPALGRDVRAAALLPDEASVDTRRLTVALLAAAEISGVSLLPGVEVTALVREANRCTGVETSVGEDFFRGSCRVCRGLLDQPDSGGLRRMRRRVPVRGQMAALRSCGQTNSPRAALGARLHRAA